MLLINFLNFIHNILIHFLSKSHFIWIILTLFELYTTSLLCNQKCGRTLGLKNRRLIVATQWVHDKSCPLIVCTKQGSYRSRASRQFLSLLYKGLCIQAAGVCLNSFRISSLKLISMPLDLLLKFAGDETSYLKLILFTSST